MISFPWWIVLVVVALVVVFFIVQGILVFGPKFWSSRRRSQTRRNGPGQ